MLREIVAGELVVERVETARVMKHGGSLCIRLPRTLRAELSLVAGDLMVVTRAGETLVLRRLDAEMAAALNRTNPAPPGR